MDLPEMMAGETSIVSVMERQLGLKLELRKAAAEVLVIDHAEKASGN